MDNAQESIRWNRLLVAILLFAFIVSMVMVVRHRHDGVTALTSDGTDYHRLAVTLVHNHTYDSVYRPPAYPAFVALVYAVTGPKPAAVFAIQALLFVATLFIVYKIVRHITNDTRTAILTIGLCALWPPFYSSVTELLTEILAGFLIALMVWLSLLSIAKPRVTRCGLAGLLLGLCCLTKSPILLFAIAPPLFILLSGKRRLYRFGTATILCLGILVVLVPWTIRNHNVTGKILPVSTGGGYNFWLGNWPEYDKKGWPSNEFPPEVQAKIDGRSEVERDPILMSIGKSYISENPTRAAGIFIRKFSKLWLGSLGQNSDSIETPVPHIGKFAVPKMALFHIPLFILAVIGWFLLPRPTRKRAYLLMTLLIIWTGVYVAVTAERRYSIPVDFCRMFLTSITLLAIAHKSPKAVKEVFAE